jgi:DnaJ-class molecular chaperone
MMGLRRPKPDPRRSDNKASNNQSSGSSCGRCGGSGTITVTASDASGNTFSMDQDCPKCGGSGNG